MQRGLALGLVALVPLAFGTGPASARTLTAHICDSSGVFRTVEIPLDDGQPAPEPCHSKGCHAGSCRKRGAQAI